MNVPGSFSFVPILSVQRAQLPGQTTYDESDSTAFVCLADALKQAHPRIQIEVVCIRNMIDCQVRLSLRHCHNWDVWDNRVERLNLHDGACNTRMQDARNVQQQICSGLQDFLALSTYTYGSISKRDKKGRKSGDASARVGTTALLR
jgi:hypothetical protein